MKLPVYSRGAGPGPQPPPRQLENMKNEKRLYSHICYKCAVEVCGNKVIILHGDVLELTRIILTYKDIVVNVLVIFHLTYS